MSDPTVGAVIVRHIDELEAALRYAHGTMQPMLAKALSSIMENKRRALQWAGETPADLDETLWVAPEDWRMSGDTEDGEFYLSFSLAASHCIDGQEPETWIGTIAGFAGAGLRLSFATDALGQRAWKALLKAQAQLVDALVGKGFLCDPKTGDLALNIHLNRETLAAGFEDEALETALEPVGAAIDRINAARPLLDRLVEAIKLSAVS